MPSSPALYACTSRGQTTQQQHAALKRTVSRRNWSLGVQSTWGVFTCTYPSTGPLPDHTEASVAPAADLSGPLMKTVGTLRKSSGATPPHQNSVKRKKRDPPPRGAVQGGLGRNFPCHWSGKVNFARCWFQLGGLTCSS